MKKKRILIRIISLLAVIAVAAWMIVIGRGHTVYLDNKTVVYEGKEYTGPYKVAVNVDGERIAKLYDGERGSTTNIGQSFEMELEITQEKGGDAKTVRVSMKLPYNLDGIVINLPALLAGLPQDAYLSEFIPVAGEEEEPADEEIVTDEFGMSEFEETP